MSFAKIAEKIIEESMARGEFDDLPASGKKIDLSDYFAAPEDLRMAHSVLKNAGFAPPEVELRRDLDALRRELQTCSSPVEHERMTRRRQQLQLTLDLIAERNRARKPPTR
jgi:hypothetical protein